MKRIIITIFLACAPTPKESVDADIKQFDISLKSTEVEIEELESRVQVLSAHPALVNIRLDSAMHQIQLNHLEVLRVIRKRKIYRCQPGTYPYIGSD